MESKEINLLEVRKEEKRFSDPKRKKATIISIGLLLVFGLIIIGIFLYGFTLQSEAEKLSENISVKEKEIEANRDKEILYRVAKSKLLGVDQVVNKRPDLVPVLNFLENTVYVLDTETAGGITFAEITVSDLNHLSLKGSAMDSNVLGDFFDLLTEKDLKSFFRKIKLSSLATGEKKGYDFSLQFDLSEQKKN